MASYDFMSDRMVKDIRKSKCFINIFPYNPSRYIINGKKDVITIIGNIFDPVTILKKNPLGIYIINISLGKYFTVSNLIPKDLLWKYLFVTIRPILTIQVIFLLFTIILTIFHFNIFSKKIKN